MTNLSESNSLVGHIPTGASTSQGAYENIDENVPSDQENDPFRHYPVINSDEDELPRFSARLQCQNCDEVVFTIVNYRIGQGTFLYSAGVILGAFVFITIFVSLILDSAFEPIMAVNFFKIWFILFIGICCSCCIVGCGGIPFCFNQFRDAEHACPRCKLVIGTRELAHVIDI